MMDINTLMLKGGPVMWVLLGYSIVALAIVIERMVYFQLRYHRISPEESIIQAVNEAHKNGISDLVQVASRVGSGELATMESGLRTLAWLGNTAPLLGLFGTITGMIKAFMVIEAAGGRVDAQALAGGIWEAMVTTGAGLAVAIPVLLLLHLLEGMVDHRTRAMQEVASLTIESLQHQNAVHLESGVHRAESVSHAV
ncbi:MAG: MotA/TolQ/ExbB proton channel family protein [Mariprofundales bacterium]|nr:MotA/TolQ/ExbB proton channel family protein [Mariprofundales bacterium]